MNLAKDILAKTFRKYNPKKKIDDIVDFIFAD